MNAWEIFRNLSTNDQVSFRDPVMGDAEETSLRDTIYLLSNHQGYLRHFTRVRFRFVHGYNDVAWISTVISDTQRNVGIGHKAGVPRNSCAYAGHKDGFRCNAGGGVECNVGDVGQHKVYDFIQRKVGDCIQHNVGSGVWHNISGDASDHGVHNVGIQRNEGLKTTGLLKEYSQNKRGRNNFGATWQQTQCQIKKINYSYIGGNSSNHSGYNISVWVGVAVQCNERLKTTGLPQQHSQARRKKIIYGAPYQQTQCQTKRINLLDGSSSDSIFFIAT